MVHRPSGKTWLSRAARKLWFQALSLWAARSPVRVVVNFGRADYLAALLYRRLPLVCWFQNPVDQVQIDWFRARHRNSLRFVGISHAQVARLETDGRMRVIPNAVNVGALGFSGKPANPPYVVFLGRLTQNKGVHLAIEAARQAGVTLKLAGNVAHDEEGGEAYFEQEVRPRLDTGCQWVGPVNDKQKSVLLQGAIALLFPIQWNEPFGIVMAESLACGTPVVAWRIASTPEVVRDGANGYLCNSVEEMARAIRRVQSGEISREACRRDAEERFSQNVLLSKFLALVNDMQQ